MKPILNLYSFRASRNQSFQKVRHSHFQSEKEPALRQRFGQSDSFYVPQNRGDPPTIASFFLRFLVYPLGPPAKPLVPRSSGRWIWASRALKAEGVSSPQPALGHWHGAWLAGRWCTGSTSMRRFVKGFGLDLGWGWGVNLLLRLDTLHSWLNMPTAAIT